MMRGAIAVELDGAVAARGAEAGHHRTADVCFDTLVCNIGH